MTDQNAAAEQAPAPSEDQELGALYEKLTEGEEIPPEEPEQEPETQPEEASEAEAEPEAEGAEEPEEKVEAPSDLPAGIRAKWGDMPEEAREAVLSSHRDLSRKMAEQGRIVQASKPIYDVLVQAAQEIPTMASMTPSQIAQDVFKMASIQGELHRDPVRTLLGIAQQYGAIDGIKQAVSGQAPDGTSRQNMQLVEEVRQLRAQLQQQADPQALEQRVMQTMTTRETERMVSEYASQKDHWQDVEPVIPQMIPIVQSKLGPNASAKDVLDRAYDMAIHADPDLRAKVAAANPAPAQPDPARTAAQRKAKSVNVTSRSSGKPKPMNEEERLAAVYDRMTQD